MSTLNRRGRVVMQILSLFGVLLCLVNAFGANLFCATQGCAIYQGYGLFGLSFYVLGAIAFSVLLVTVSWPRCHPWLPWILGIGLAADVVFLVYQYLFWPCASCLVVALILGGITAIAWKTVPAWRSLGLLSVGAIWGLFFVIISLGVIKELAFRPWALAGKTDAPVQVYFSPSCPACQAVVNEIVSRADIGQIAFFPIAESSDDARKIARIKAVLNGCSPTMTQVYLPKVFQGGSSDTCFCSTWRTRLGLWCNKMVLAKMGASTVPLIVAPNLQFFDPLGMSTPGFNAGCPVGLPQDCF